MAQLHTVLILALDGEWSASCAGRSILMKRTPDTHWVGSKASLDAMDKCLFPKVGTEPRYPIIENVA
jgi:hypothetical protein